MTCKRTNHSAVIWSHLLSINAKLLSLLSGNCFCSARCLISAEPVGYIYSWYQMLLFRANVRVLLSEYYKMKVQWTKSFGSVMMVVSAFSGYGIVCSSLKKDLRILSFSEYHLPAGEQSRHSYGLPYVINSFLLGNLPKLSFRRYLLKYCKNTFLCWVVSVDLNLNHKAVHFL